MRNMCFQIRQGSLVPINDVRRGPLVPVKPQRTLITMLTLINICHTTQTNTKRPQMVSYYPQDSSYSVKVDVMFRRERVRNKTLIVRFRRSLASRCASFT